MGWIAVGLTSAAVSGVLSIIDKQTLSKYLPSVRSFGLLLSVLMLFWGVGTLIAVPPSPDVSASLFAITILSGVFLGAGLLIYFYVLRIEEVSRTSPVFHTYPAIVAVLGVSFLGETLSGLQWLAVLLTIAGAILISIRGSPGNRSILGRSFGLLILASFLAAVGWVTSKYALENVPFWNVFALRSLGSALPFLLFFSRNASESLRELLLSLKHPVGRIYIIGGEVFYASFAVWLALVAVSLGPVSIVSALIGTRPVFVFLYSSLLSTARWRVMDEPLSRDILVTKTIAIVMVMVGVGAISIL